LVLSLLLFEVGLIVADDEEEVVNSFLNVNEYKMIFTRRPMQSRINCEWFVKKVMSTCAKNFSNRHDNF